MRYQCTECDTVHPTLAQATACHYGIGGVVEVSGDRIYYFEATMPPVRKADLASGFRDRADSLVAALDEGAWNSDIQRLGKVVTWTVTVPDGFEAGYLLTDTTEFVGYHCSDTIGPTSRKAKLKVRVGDGEWVGPLLCPGAW